MRGTQYIDEILFMDVNGDPSADNDADIDVTAGGESGESPADKRYFYHQDRNWNVVALTEYSPPGSPSNVSGRVAERYAYTPYGEFVVLTGDSGNGDMGARRTCQNAIGMLGHQGLSAQPESAGISNRRREYNIGLGRFYQRDPVPSRHAYVYEDANPIVLNDSGGAIPISGKGTKRRCCCADGVALGRQFPVAGGFEFPDGCGSLANGMLGIYFEVQIMYSYVENLYTDGDCTIEWWEGASRPMSGRTGTLAEPDVMVNHAHPSEIGRFGCFRRRWEGRPRPAPGETDLGYSHELWDVPSFNPLLGDVMIMIHVALNSAPGCPCESSGEAIDLRVLLQTAGRQVFDVTP